MTVFLKNINTGLTWEYDGETDFEAVNERLKSGNFELLDKDKIGEKELEKLTIPEIPTTLPTKERLISKLVKK